MSEHDSNNDGFESGWRWISEQLSRSVERLDEMDIEQVARAAGVDVDRAREFLGDAGQWLNDHADSFVGEAGLRFGDFGDVVRGTDPGRGSGPHPLDPPTAAQGLALSALDSGRWTVKPGSHVLVTHGEGPAPADALGTVGELRARDWINADGALTLVGRNALTRWMERGDV